MTDTTSTTKRCTRSDTDGLEKGCIKPEVHMGRCKVREDTGAEFAGASQAGRGPGRPKGSANAEAPTVPVEPSRCPKCGSTQRSEYYAKVEREISGVTREGRPYTHVVWRRTRCAACGQIRIDKAFEERKGPAE